MYNLIYIEDNPDDADYMEILAEDIDQIDCLDTAQTLAEGLAKIKSKNYDLACLDLSLPDSSGLDIIDRMQEHFPHLPLVVFTGLDDFSNATRAINKGAQDYLVKGEFDEKLLWKTIQYALERHKHHGSLRKAQLDLQKAEEMTSLGSWEFTPEGEVCMISDGMLHIFGLPESNDFTNINDYLKFIIEEDVEHVKNELNQLIKTGQPIFYTERIRTTNNEVRYLETRVELIQKTAQDAPTLFGASVDVTKAKITELQLKESEEKLLEAQKLANIGSWEYDVGLETLIGSPNFYHILGINEDDIPDSKFISIAAENDEYHRIFKLIRRQTYRSDSFSQDLSIINSEGKTKHLKLTAQKHLENNGWKQMIIRGTIQDITVLKEAEIVKERFTQTLEDQVERRTHELLVTKNKLEASLEKEKELGHLKSQFVSSASHQFRTPLTVIQARVDLLDLQLNQISPEVAPLIRKSTSRIRHEVARMTNLMNEVLLLGKIEAKSVVPKFEEVSLPELIKNLVTNHNQIQEDGRVASFEIIGTPRSISTDGKLIQEALANVVSNAFKYSKDRPAPSVRLNFSARSVVLIEVQDFGIGIPEQAMNNLFEPFYRAPNAIGVQGTGLGTTIIKEYVELCKGQLLVESTEDTGSLFAITLPG